MADTPGTKSNCFLTTHLKCRKVYSPASHWYFVDNAPNTLFLVDVRQTSMFRSMVKSPLQRSAAPEKGMFYLEMILTIPEI